MKTFDEAINIAFLKHVKVAHDILMLPAVDRQQGKVWNYIVVCCDEEYNGVYRWDAVEAPKLKHWKNKTLECYKVPISICTKIKELEELDESTSLGRYILRIVRRIQNGNVDKRTI